MATQPGFDFGTGSGFVDGGGGIARPHLKGFEFGAFAQGFDEGYAEGFSDGSAEGYDEGFDDGFAAGLSAAAGPEVTPPLAIEATFSPTELIAEFDIVTEAVERLAYQFRSGDPVEEDA